jgi:hypothetical protein
MHLHHLDYRERDERSRLRLFAIKELFFRIWKGRNMWKEKLHFLGNYIIKHSKVVLPAVVVVAVAVTVSVSLSMNNRHREEQQNAESAAAQGILQNEQPV